MRRRRPGAVSIRLARAAAWLLAVAPAFGAAPPALAGSVPADAAGLQAWAADTAVHALQRMDSQGDPTVGLREVLNRSASLGALGLQQAGPDWLRRFTFKLALQEDLRPAYDVVATQPVLRSWRGDRLWLRGHLAHDPNGALAADLGLLFRPRLGDQAPTLSLSGLFEEHRLPGYRRYGVVAALRSPDLEVTGTLFDDVAHTARPDDGIADRALDGYDIALAARVPGLSWAWLRARQRWQIAVDGTQPSTRDDLGLQLRPFGPVELEAGASDDGQRSDWYTRLRLKLKLGSG